MQFSLLENILTVLFLSKAVDSLDLLFMPAASQQGRNFRTQTMEKAVVRSKNTNADTNIHNPRLFTSRTQM